MAAVVESKTSEVAFRAHDVREYYVEVSGDVKSFFAVDEFVQKRILGTLCNIFKRVEEQNPAKTYEVHILGGIGDNPVEIYLKANGSRDKPQTDLTFRAPPSGVCPFCDIREQVPAYTQQEDSPARVIKSRQQLPLIISTNHYQQWFDADVETQLSLLKTAEQMLKHQKASNHHIHTHIGFPRQKVSHLHVHVKSGLSLT